MTNTTPERIPILNLQKKLESTRKPIVIDVREPREVAETGSIPGAQHIPMFSVEKRMNEFSKGSEIVFYWGGGGRASRAAEAYMKAGFKKVHYCGLRDWKKEGLPTE